jgi:hypothetical protein
MYTRKEREEKIIKRSLIKQTVFTGATNPGSHIAAYKAKVNLLTDEKLILFYLYIILFTVQKISDPWCLSNTGCLCIFIP